MHTPQIIESFLDNAMNYPHVWEDYHGVSFRTLILVNSWWTLRESGVLTFDLSTKILKALEVHGDFLLDESHFEEGHNHAITQAVALVALSLNFPELPNSQIWFETGRERLDGILASLVDEDGALIENSPYYHFYALQKFWEVASYTSSQNVEISEEFDQRLHAMIVYGMYVLQPNLEVPLIGASLKAEIRPQREYNEMLLDNEEFEYVLTKGESGQEPSLLNIHFPATGQTIMRSGWGSGEEFEQQTQVIFDVGAYRTSHSDLDALSVNIYSNGIDLITDSGLYTYEPGEYRSYFNGTGAHNTVVVNGEDQRRGSAIIGDFEEGEGYALQTGLHDLYPGVTHSRAVALLGHDYVLIVDYLISSHEQHYEQKFHLFPDAELTVDGLTVNGTGRIPSQQITIHQLVPEGITLDTSYNDNNQPSGLCSQQYEIALPCYEVSYVQDGSTVAYITLLEIGEPDPNLVTAVGEDLSEVRITTRTSAYSIGIDLPDLFHSNDVRAEPIDDMPTYDFRLVNNNGVWQLETDDNPNYALTTAQNPLYDTLVSNVPAQLNSPVSGEILAIRNIGADAESEFTVTIDNLGTFQSSNGVAYTPIPVNSSIDTVRVYEQEDMVPIFGYHNILEDDVVIRDPETEMHVSDFAAQVESATNEMHCRWYTFGEIMADYVLKQEKIPEHACVMTFDDGHRNNYEVALPVLEQYNVVATFFIPPAFIASTTEESSLYMSWKELDELYAKGHEIGSHAFNGGSLTIGNLDQSDLVFQIGFAKQTLEARGYRIRTFAYPHGNWNDEIIDILKDVGHIAARDTIKDNTWRDVRPITVGHSDDLIWHMHYHKPELQTPEQLVDSLRYTGWWQFEEDLVIVQDDDGDIKIRSSLDPTSTSYAAVYLYDAGDSIENEFLVSTNAAYTINILASTDAQSESIPVNITVMIDGIPRQVTPGETWSCIQMDSRRFCEFSATMVLNKGVHQIQIAASGGETILDKFSVFQAYERSDVYHLTITENPPPEPPMDTNRQIRLAVQATSFVPLSEPSNQAYLMPLMILGGTAAGLWIIRLRRLRSV